MIIAPGMVCCTACYKLYIIQCYNMISECILYDLYC